MRFPRSVLMLLPGILLSYSAVVSAGPLHIPPAYQAKYSVTANGIKVGEMERTLGRDDGAYILETRMYTTGFIALLKEDRMVESSRWTVEDGQLIPLRYEFHHTGGRREKTEIIDFNWREGVISGSRNKRTKKFATRSGLTDKLSYQVLLRQYLAEGRRQFEFEVAEWNRIRTYRFQFVGTETIETPVGDFETVKVERVRKDDDDRETVFWCAPALDYMLVQIIQEENGSTFASYLLDVERAPTPLTASR